MNHLNSIYQRLQSNYSDCDITYAPGLLTVKCKNGEIRADGFRTCFLEDGKTVQELLEKNDDNLYEEMERFILYLQEGGADAAQSDELKMLEKPCLSQCIYTFRQNCRSYFIDRRRCRTSAFGVLFPSGSTAFLFTAIADLADFFTGSDCLCAQKDPRPDLDLSELWLPASFDLFSFFSYH